MKNDIYTRWYRFRQWVRANVQANPQTVKWAFWSVMLVAGVVSRLLFEYWHVPNFLEVWGFSFAGFFIACAILVRLVVGNKLRSDGSRFFPDGVDGGSGHDSHGGHGGDGAGDGAGH